MQNCFTFRRLLLTGTLGLLLASGPALAERPEGKGQGGGKAFWPVQSKEPRGQESGNGRRNEYRDDQQGNHQDREHRRNAYRDDQQGNYQDREHRRNESGDDQPGNYQDREHRRNEYRDDQPGNYQDREHRRNAYRDDHQGDHRDRYRDGHGPSIDEVRVRTIFRDYHERRDYHHDYDDLPPGIRMNLRRGKPLPPGIAKRFDRHVYSRLPHYDGYEWYQVGPDAVLVEIATQNIHLVLEHMLD